MPTSNPLPPKENALFKRILKCYEQKQYKNGLKYAKQILSNPKYADHGETLAMRGLSLNCLGRKDEAYDNVRKGLRNDLRSHVCWHVYGLLQRSDRKYDEAIKCYRNALKWDKDNLQILRDLSLLQIQMRDLDGYKDTRYQLLVLKPAQRASWIGYAMSFHLLKDYEMALKVVEEFRKTQLSIRPFDYEHSELLLYQNMLMVEAGMYEEALQHLNKYEHEVVDKLAVQEITAELLIKLNQASEAVPIYKSLLTRNPENHAYYQSLEDCLNIQGISMEERLSIYTKQGKAFPRALAPMILPLRICEGEMFKTYADEFMRVSLHKGVPPLFTCLKQFYKDPQKVKLFEDIALGYVDSLKSNGYFHLTNSKEKVNEKESPAALLWTYYFLAQHFDFLRNTEKALSFINLALDHTVTLIELYLVKARIYKHAGEVDEAAKCLDEAQSLDTADRYINSKCAKYMLRANMIKDAEEMCSKFTREGVPATENLNEMQCMWFQVECARAYARMGNYGEALKKCHEIDRHFTEITEDQFDFHTYCMRKMTLRSYVRLLRQEDVLRSHTFYFKAATLAIEIYLQLHDSPYSELDSSQLNSSGELTASELRKIRNKQRKAQKKLQQEKEKQKVEDQKKEQASKKLQDAEIDGPKEEELLPDQLVKVDNPLEESVKFLKPLQAFASHRMETHIMSFHVYWRKRKILLMLQSIKRGFYLDINHPKFHPCLIQFLNLMKNSNNMSDSVKIVLEEETSLICGSCTPNELNKSFYQRNLKSYPHRVAFAEAAYMLDSSMKEEILRMLMNFEDNLNGVTLQVCSEVLEMLKNGSFGDCDKYIDAYKQMCHQQFPYAITFRSDELNHVGEESKPTDD